MLQADSWSRRTTLVALGFVMTATLACFSPYTRALPTAHSGSAGPLVIQQPSLWPDFHYEVRHSGEQMLTLRVAVSDPSWVRLELDGRSVFEGTLAPGNDQTWQARRSLVAHLGNPRGLRVTLQGEPLLLDWEGPIHLSVDG